MGIPALESEIFRILVGVVIGVLAFCGATIVSLRALFRTEMKGIVRTYRSWLVMAPIPILAILGGRILSIVLCSVLSVLVFREFARATGLMKDTGLTWLVTAFVVLQSLFTIVTDPWLGTPGWYGMFIVLPVYAIGAVVMTPIVRNRSEGQLTSVSLAIFGYLYFGWMLGASGLPRERAERHWVFALLNLRCQRCGRRCIYFRQPLRQTKTS